MPSFSFRRALVGVLGLAALAAAACGGGTPTAPPSAAQEPAAAATVAATTQSPAAPAAPAAAAPAQAAMPAATVAPAPTRATATPVTAARATVAPAPTQAPAAAPAPVVDPVSVVTTSNIVGDWVDVVGGDRVDVNSLLAAGGDPHSFNPGARDVANVADADLVMVIGLGLEASWLEDLIKNAARDEDSVVELGDAVDAIPFEPLGEDAHDDHDDHDEHEDEDEHGHDEDEDAHDEDEDEHDHDEEDEHDEDEDDHDHDEEEGHDEDEDEHDHDEDAHDEDEDEHDHDEEEGHDEDEDEHDHDEDAHDEDEDEHDHDEDEDDHGHGHDDHAHGEFDPHFWFDPIRVKVAVNEVAERLSEEDPAGAAVYRDNAAAYNAELDALHAWIEEQVAQIPAERRALVTSHDSFSYFAERYGFKVVGTVIPGLTTEREPSAQEVAGLVDTIRELGVRAIFAETTVQDAIVQSVARETGASVATLYTGSLGASGSGADTYIGMVRANTQAIVDALR